MERGARKRVTRLMSKEALHPRRFQSNRVRVEADCASAKHITQVSTKAGQIQGSVAIDDPSATRQQVSLLAAISDQP
jgi:hypothetical protein